jgi:hypothetical protein
MPYDGSHGSGPVNGLHVPLSNILELQDLGWSSTRIARYFGEEPSMVRSAACRAGSPFSLTREMVFSPVLRRPISDDLMTAMRELPPDRCVYIAAELNDSDARPCGAACCIVQVKYNEPVRSSWCEVHHRVVKPDAINVDVPRRIWSEEE